MQDEELQKNIQALQDKMGLFLPFTAEEGHQLLETTIPALGMCMLNMLCKVLAFYSLTKNDIVLSQKVKKQQKKKNKKASKVPQPQVKEYFYPEDFSQANIRKLEVLSKNYLVHQRFIFEVLKYFEMDFWDIEDFLKDVCKKRDKWGFK